jgi:hypothetical protein
MEDSAFDEVEFFRSLAASGARALLIGRRALVALGLPVLTADYDFWLHIDDISRFNDVGAAFDLEPNHAPDAARARGRYVLENDERIDVLVGRSVPTTDGVMVSFDEVWAKRQSVALAPGVSISLPCIDDLIRTKRFADRPKDAEDIRMLLALQETTGRGR